MAEKVLAVEDEPVVLELINAVLSSGGFSVVGAHDGQEGLRLFFQERPDLVMVDLMLPKMDGYELTRRIREIASTPIIIVSAKDQEIDKVHALEAGADDYVTKPFGSKELVARAHAAIRRSRMPTFTDSPQTYRDDELTVDFQRHEVLLRGQSVTLTPIEFRLLSVFVHHAGQVLTQERLLDQVWGVDYDSLETVKWHVNRLRRKIEDDPDSPHRILTIRGMGYRFERQAAPSHA